MTDRDPRAATPYRPTLSAIAQQAGVSIATVSKVLNHRPDVSAQTRRRVEQLLDHHGYPRRDREQPWLARSNLVDVLMIGMDDPWASQVLSAFEAAAREAGLGIVPAPVGATTVPGEVLRRILARGSRGMIFVFADLAPRQRALLETAQVPYVLVGHGEAVPDGVRTVGIDYRAGTRVATEHLIDLGRERIALIVGSRGRLYDEDRVEGYRDALRERGIVVDPALVRTMEVFSEDCSRAETLGLWALDEPPTAIVAGTDMIAVGVFAALQELGLRPGQDVGVVGFDGRPEAAWLRPPLTTISQPLDEIARAAISLLTDERAGWTHTVRGTLVIRGSTVPRS
ncbi:LacI family DNA-binding transcriptional regulator [Streptomyces sp. NBC_01618]|uniref:LacI family DNA-binding transcriptional regulator n=1 Tax=Streptomyces sp. NBC_01618 TaxID=2975900 RepID=UPI003865EC4D|nr:LacI family transcriptional regulator [Streptomyces sp. NBC_01618]